MTAPKWWDFTIPEKDITREELVKKFENAKADKFVIGSEEGTLTGYKHYQCKAHFRKPMTFEELGKYIGEWHREPSIRKDFTYCEKEGNFYRSWEGALAKFHDLKLLPWQGQVIADLKEQNERQCTVILDREGANGKSYLSKHLVVRYGYAYVPPMTTTEDYMFMAMAHPNAKGFVFDIPRAENSQQEKAMWSAMETIKNGYLYDKRYSFTEKWIEPPKMLVFTNDKPPSNMLSADRWRVYELIKKRAKTDAYLTRWENDL